MNDNNKNNKSFASQLGYILGCALGVCITACLIALMLSATINLIALLF